MLFRSTIKDSYLGIKDIDRIKQYSEASKKGESRAKVITDAIWKDIELQQKVSQAKPVDSLYTGTYSDKWLGKAMISVKNGKLWFDSKRSPKLTGELIFYKANTFVVKWDDRSMDADAFAMFDFDENGKASGIKMKPISPLTDFSYDFQDLEFTRK